MVFLERGQQTPPVKCEKEVPLEELGEEGFSSSVLPLVFSEPRMFESLNVLSSYFNAAAHIYVVPEQAAIKRTFCNISNKFRTAIMYTTSLAPFRAQRR